MHTRRESLIPQNSDYSQTNQFWTRKKITKKKTHVFRANLPKLSIKVKIDFHSSLFPPMVTHMLDTKVRNPMILEKLTPRV